MRAVELAPIRIEEAKAGEYVAAHGGAREQARLAGILTATAPLRLVVKELEGLQALDGGFPGSGADAGGLDCVVGAPASGAGRVAATCAMLAQLKDLPPLAGSPMASRAVAFLRRMQGTDGSWHEQGADPLELTAMATYMLLTMEPEQNDPIARAARWIRGAALDQASTRALAWVWAISYRLQGAAAPETRAAWDALQSRLGAARPSPRGEAPANSEPGGETAADLGLLLTCAWEVGAGGPYLLPLAQHLVRLASMQQADGSWSAPGSAPAPDAAEPAGGAAAGQTLEITLTALRVFRGFGPL